MTKTLHGLVCAVAVVAGICAMVRAADVVQVKLNELPTAPAKQLGSASFDKLDGWGNCNLPEDRPIRYALTGPDEVHEGEGAVKFTLDTDIGPMGMKYFQLEKLTGSVKGSDGYTYWMKGDGTGGVVEIRLSQQDWSAWDSPPVINDFIGWRKIVVLKSECNFANWGRNGPDWDKLRVAAVRFSGRSGSIILDDLQFHSGTASLKVRRLPPNPAPAMLQIDLTRELPAIPDMLKGTDFALINWGAKMKELNFGPETTRLFNESGAKLVRFWTFCPPLEVSPAKDQYNWERFDAQMQKIKNAGAATIMTCCFTPKWLSVDGTKEGIPRSWDEYEKLVRDTVAHCKEKGFRVAYWESWNEPNLSGDGFLKGKLPQFLELHAHFVKAVRQADASARVGGGGFASPDTVWIRELVEHSARNDLPLDFVSWHVYDLLPEGLGASIDATRKILAEHGDKFAKTQMIIDEWQCTGGPKDQYDSEYSAAYAIAALHQMIDKGLSAQTFFAFKESSPEFAASGGNWGEITRADIPKASYFAHQAFNELNGPRVAVLGGDNDTNAIAVRNGDGVDVLVYRFNSDPDAAERTVHLELVGWTGGAVGVEVSLIDKAHSNALFDRSVRSLQQVATWHPIDPSKLPQLEIPLDRLAVALLRITPAKNSAAALPLPLNAGKALVAVAGQPLALPKTAGAAQWKGPDNWDIDQKTAVVRVPAVQRRARKVFFTAQTDSAASSIATNLVTAGVDLTIDAGTQAWTAGGAHKAHMRMRNNSGLTVVGKVSLWAGEPALIEPASIEVKLPAQSAGEPAEQMASFTVSLPKEANATSLLLYPRIEVTQLLAGDGSPISVAYPEPSQPLEADEFTGNIEGAIGFEPGAKFGDAALLKGGSIQFPADCLPSQVGTAELWITPK